MKYRYTYFVGNDYLAETVCGDINTIGIYLNHNPHGLLLGTGLAVLWHGPPFPQL